MSKCRQQKMYGHGCNFYLSAYYKYLMNSFYSACETSGIKQQQQDYFVRFICRGYTCLQAQHFKGSFYKRKGIKFNPVEQNGLQEILSLPPYFVKNRALPSAYRQLRQMVAAATQLCVYVVCDIRHPVSFFTYRVTRESRHQIRT